MNRKQKNMLRALFYRPKSSGSASKDILRSLEELDRSLEKSVGKILKK
jgi:hypothetical protein